MKPNTLPVRIDMMPREAREPSAKPFFTPSFLIALALSAIPFRWSGRLLSEESIPVCAVLDALRQGGWKIVPMERADYESRDH
jgi:hypothetical protein